jgi:heme/copper-type cytochrome/quinol oxidase subunit 3
MASVTSAPPAVMPRRRQTLIGTSLVAAAATMYLLTQLGAYLSARGLNREMWLAEHEVPLTQPNVMMFTLLLSVVTAQWAVWAIVRDVRSQAYLATAVTLLFGLAFLNQAWFLNITMGIPVDGLEGGTFYSVTSSHLVMMIGAILFFALMAFRALGGNFGSRYPDGITAAVVFWDVTVMLFSVIWIVVYVMK